MNHLNHYLEKIVNFSIRKFYKRLLGQPKEQRILT